MRTLLKALLGSGLILLGMPALADERHLGVVVSGILAGAVRSDIDESEAIPDYYKDYNLEADRGFEVRLLFGDLNGGGLYASVGSLSAEDSGNVASHSFDNVAFGGTLATTFPYWGHTEGYARGSLGIGASRFDSGLAQDRKTHALAEAQFEIGLAFYDRVTAGMGIRLQYIGHPAETIAVATIPQINLSLWL
ncbi:MAG: hypothetical protein REI12_12575 [Pedobacter sp.]|nr:hypothetical protein [Pedobacter sp.]